MKENLLKNKTVGGEHTEIALEIHMKETGGVLVMPGFHYTTSTTTTTQKQSDYKVEQSSFTLIALF